MIERRRVYRGKIMPVAGWLLAVAPLGVWVLWLVYNDGSADSLVCPLAVSWLPFVAGFGLAVALPIAATLALRKYRSEQG